MKKKVLIVFLVLIITLCACSTSNSGYAENFMDSYMAENSRSFCNNSVRIYENCDVENVSLTVSSVEYTPGEKLDITAYWHNDTESTFVYGMGYKVFGMTDDKKTELQSDRVWEFISFAVNPSSVVPAETNTPIKFVIIGNYEIQTGQEYKIEMPFYIDNEEHTASISFIIPN